MAGKWDFSNGQISGTFEYTGVESYDEISIIYEIWHESSILSHDGCGGKTSKWVIKVFWGPMLKNQS